MDVTSEIRKAYLSIMRINLKLFTPLECDSQYIRMFFKQKNA